MAKEDCAEATLLKDVDCKAVIEVAGGKVGANKLLLEDVPLQALRPARLSQAMIAKLKLIKVQAGKVLLLKAMLQEGLTYSKLKLGKVEAGQCQGSGEALVCKAVMKAPPETKLKLNCLPVS